MSEDNVQDFQQKIPSVGATLGMTTVALVISIVVSVLAFLVPYSTIPDDAGLGAIVLILAYAVLGIVIGTISSVITAYLVYRRISSIRVKTAAWSFGGIYLLSTLTSIATLPLLVLLPLLFLLPLVLFKKLKASIMFIVIGTLTAFSVLSGVTYYYAIQENSARINQNQKSSNYEALKNDIENFQGVLPVTFNNDLKLPGSTGHNVLSDFDSTPSPEYDRVITSWDYSEYQNLTVDATAQYNFDYCIESNNCVLRFTTTAGNEVYELTYGLESQPEPDYFNYVVKVNENGNAWEFRGNDEKVLLAAIEELKPVTAQEYLQVLSIDDANYFGEEN